MNIEIRSAVPADIPKLMELTKEFAEHANLSQYFETTAEKLSEVMFGNNSFVRGLLVYAEGQTAGYALFFPGFLSFRGQRSVFLEDIYIRPEYRSQGIGEKLIARLARIGRREFGAVRLDLNVDAENSKAILLYIRLGGKLDPSEHRVKYVDKAFTKLAR